MKICIIQKQLFPYIGVMAISGVLKQNGHQMDVLIQAAETDLISSLTTVKPDLIGFSVLSSEHKWLKDLILDIKDRMPNIPIVVGGIHAILYPEDVLKLEGVDYVCNGEGEVALPLLAARLEKKGKSAEGIVGIGYKKDDKPILHEVAPLTADLNSFMEDRAIYYDRYPELKDLSLKQFMTSRGCPFKCSFCANCYLMDKFKDSGPYIRRKSPEHLINEVKQTIEEYGATAVFFNDDLFVSHMRWLEKFTLLYKKEINLPYMCTARAGVINTRHVKMLADSGCHTISIGVESGNEQLRRGVLNKNITDKTLLKCAEIIKNAGIELQTSNMFCLPEETIKDAISTIDLNVKMGTNYMFTTIFLPFPKTPLAEYCIQKNYLKKDYSFEDMPESFVVKSVLTEENVDYIANLHKIAHLCIKFPQIKSLLISMASKIRSEKLFAFFFLLGTLIRYKEERKIPSYIQTIRYLWLLRKGY